MSYNAQGGYQKQNYLAQNVNSPRVEDFALEELVPRCEAARDNGS